MKKLKYIFLADDDKDDQSFFSEALKDIDPLIVCRMADNGQAALRNLKESQETPDIIFLDMNMPILNGLDCLEMLKKDPRLAQVPICMLTTSVIESSKAKSLGASLFLTKPPSYTELKALINYAIETCFPE